MGTPLLVSPTPPSRLAEMMAAKVEPIVTDTSMDATLGHRHDDGELTPTDLWGPSVGDNLRGCDDPRIRAYRLAVGLPHLSDRDDQPGGLEAGCGTIHSLPSLKYRRSHAVGLYQLVLKSQRRKDRLHGVLDLLLYALYVLQVVLGATLTALGPSSAGHPIAITLLGAANTVIAALLALIKGQSLPERFRKDEMEFRRARDFIEETEALILAGISGRDLKDIGRLVTTSFKMYNTAKMNEENNRPGSYVRQGGKSNSSG